MRNTILIGLISKEADNFLSTQPRFVLDLFYRKPEAVPAIRYRLGLRALWVHDVWNAMEKFEKLGHTAGDGPFRLTSCHGKRVTHALDHFRR